MGKDVLYANRWTPHGNLHHEAVGSGHLFDLRESFNGIAAKLMQSNRLLKLPGERSPVSRQTVQTGHTPTRLTGGRDRFAEHNAASA